MWQLTVTSESKRRLRSTRGWRNSWNRCGRWSLKWSQWKQERERLWPPDWKQIPGTTSEVSVQKRSVLRTAKRLCRTLKLPDLWYRTREVRHGLASLLHSNSALQYPVSHSTISYTRTYSTGQVVQSWPSVTWTWEYQTGVKYATMKWCGPASPRSTATCDRD